MTHLGRQWLGYFVAPLIPALTIFVIVGGMPMVSMQLELFFIVIYSLSFLIMCVVALPLLVFCFKQRRLLDCIFTGIVTGILVAVALILLGGKPIMEISRFEQILIGVVFFTAILSSVVFWLVAYWEPGK